MSGIYMFVILKNELVHSGTHRVITMVMFLVKCCSIVFWRMIQHLLPSNQTHNSNYNIGT